MEIRDINVFGSVYLNSKEKFQKYLDNNKNLLSIKIKNNIELDVEDLKELKQLLYSNEEVDLESLKTENNSEIEKYLMFMVRMKVLEFLFVLWLV